MILKICLKCLNFAYADVEANLVCSSCKIPYNFFDSAEMLNVLHADMDAFFANVEINDNPNLINKPVIVGGPSKSRGVVATCSYEARKYGVHSGMPLYKVQKLCPNAVFISPRMERYIEVSKQVFEIFESFTPIYEPLSIDEAYLDLKGTERLLGHPIISAIKLKDKIKKLLGLTVSIGVSYNKFLAKLASDENKPDGIFILTPNNTISYLDSLKIEKMIGVGSKTLPHMKKFNINTIKDLRLCSLIKLKSIFGNNYIQYYNLSRGIDNREIKNRSEIKSIGKEITLENDICDLTKMKNILWLLSEKIARRLNRKHLKGKTIVLKLKTNDFKLITKRITSQNLIYIDTDIYKLAEKLLSEIIVTNLKVRLVGITILNLLCIKMESNQMLLFPNENKKSEKEKLNKAINLLKDRFGENIISRAIKLNK